MIQSFENAVNIINDPKADSLERVEAVRYLGELGTDEALQVLVTLLEDDDYGVRWAAADELAKKGARGAILVARRLLDPDASARVMEMALHVFKDNSDLLVRSQSEKLVKALQSEHPIEAMTEASHLLNALTA